MSTTTTSNAPAALTSHRAVRTIQDVEVARVEGHPLYVDLYLPADVAEPVPTVVYLHGGGWRAGTRKDNALRQLLPLAARGIAVISADYRLSGTASFPAQLHDVKAAVRWVRATAGTYGFDAARIGALGASSGGHLAGLLALTSGHPELEGGVGDHLELDSSIGAAALLFPVVDPAQWDLETEGREQPGPDTFAGRYPSWPPPARAALPLGIDDVRAKPELAAAASLLTYVRADAPPFLILHGDADTAVFIEHSQRLRGAPQRAGARSSLLVVAGADHEGPEFGTPEVVGAIAAFFEETLVRGAI